VVAPPIDTAQYGMLAMLLTSIKANDEKYDVRSGLVYRALVEAHRLGLACGFRIDPNEPDWPVAYIELPFGGQVSWHMPAFPQAWDGHTTEEKFRRIDRLCLVVATGIRR